MRRLPLDHPGIADHRSPMRFLWWLIKGQRHTMLAGMAFGVVWMVAQAVMPAIIGRAIDDGIAAKDTHALLLWTGVMLSIGLVQAFAGIMRHRFAVTNWLTTAYRTVQLVARQHDADRVAVVEDGRITALGSHDELVAHGGCHAGLWESWHGKA